MEGDDDNDNINTNDAYVGNSFCDTSTVSAVEVSPGDADYRIVESLNSTETEAESFNGRMLAVVAVRGSVTFTDRVVDLGNRFNF